MSEHVDNKRLVNKHITDSEDIKLIISRCALKAVDKQILTMILAEKNDEGFVADTLGYSYSRLKWRFSKALPVFVSVARQLHKL